MTPNEKLVRGYKLEPMYIAARAAISEELELRDDERQASQVHLLTMLSCAGVIFWMGFAIGGLV